MVQNSGYKGEHSKKVFFSSFPATNFSPRKGPVFSLLHIPKAVLNIYKLIRVQCCALLFFHKWSHSITNAYTLLVTLSI